MHRYLGILAAAMFVAACGNGEKDHGHEDDDTDNNQCGSEIISTFPAAGANGVYYRTAVEFQLDVVKGGESITVSAGGTAVPGTTMTEGKRIIWTPTNALSPSTQYDVTLDWDCGPTTIDWTTSNVGSEVDSGGLDGYTFSLDLASGRIVKPEGVGALLQQFLDQEILIGVTYADGTQIEMMGALGTPQGNQDLCTPTIEFPVAADFSENPYFSVIADVLELNIQGVDLKISNLEISGAFAPGASSIEGAVLSGSIDVRDVADLLDMDGDEACALVGQFGVNCEPCAGGGNYCLTVHVDSMSAPRAQGVTLESRSNEDIAADPTCP